MKRLWITLVAIAALVTGCALDRNDNPTPKAAVEIRCLDVHNPGSTACAAKAATLEIISAAHAEQTIDAGVVTRSQLIEVSQLIHNLTPSPFEGFIEARFDAGCNGASEWIVMAKQPVTVAAGDEVSLSVGGSCGDMPVGARQLVATAYGPDGTTVVDSATVRFTLIE